MPHLENWSLRNKYYGFDLESGFLEGVVTGHEKIADGVAVETSGLIFISIAEKVAATFSGTFYTLGNINPEYESWVQRYAIGK